MRFQEKDLELDIYLSGLCRDDRCLRTDVHKQHAINDTRITRSRRRRRFGWVDDPLEPMPASTKEPTEILEGCVLEVTSSVIPKSYGMIERDLAHLYGECGERRLQRCLARMSQPRNQHRKLLCIDLRDYNNGGDLRAYLHPNTRLADDPMLIYEQLTAEFASSAYDHDRATFERALRGDPPRAYRGPAPEVGRRAARIFFERGRQAQRLERFQRSADERLESSGEGRLERIRRVYQHRMMHERVDGVS